MNQFYDKRTRDMKKYRREKKTALAICLFIFIMVGTGCSRVHVYQAGGPAGREMGNQPGTEWESKRVNTFLWGGIRQDVIIENCVLGDGSRLNIEEVKIEKNFGSIIASIITLGIWEPAKVSWRCAKPKQPSHD
jgi:hypothetical protein